MFPPSSPKPGSQNAAAVFCKFNSKSRDLETPANSIPAKQPPTGALLQCLQPATKRSKRQNSKVGPKVAKEATALPRKCQKAKGLQQQRRRLKMAQNRTILVDPMPDLTIPPPPQQAIHSSFVHKDGESKSLYNLTQGEADKHKAELK